MYRLLIHWKDGRITEQSKGYSPSIVRSFERTISRNSKVIQRIELHDHEGCIDTIWDASWEKPS